MNNQTNQHNQSGYPALPYDYETQPYQVEEETYLSDPAKAIEQLDNWLSLGHGLAGAFKLLKVEEGFELTIPDYEQKGTYWLLGDKPAKTRAGAMQRLGAALDQLSEPESTHQRPTYSASSSLALASQKTAFNSPEP